MKKVFHICVDYPYTHIYHQLLMQFSQKSSMSHFMFVPLAENRLYTHDYNIHTENVEVHYSYAFKSIDRYFYMRKQKKILEHIENRFVLNSPDLIHSHTLFSGGGSAYLLHKKRNIKYIVVLRNVDVNYFFKYAVHLRGFGIKILTGASQIILLSPAYKNILLNKILPERLKKEIENKISIIPNGVNNYWLQNLWSRENVTRSGRLVLVYAGELKKNKNLDTSIRVFYQLRKKGYDVYFIIVGDGPEKKRLMKMTCNDKERITFTGWLNEKNRLRDIYRKSDIFLMPSFNESFGVAYAEAMTQGLPVIYTKGQGIDGFFDEGTVGYACDPVNASQIADAVEKIYGNYEMISNKCTANASKFSWDRVADRYESLYQSLLG